MKPTLLLAPLAGLLAGCMMNLSHTRETEQEMSEEEQLELYTTSATYLYDDNSLQRAQGQAVKALELDPHNEAMRRMVGWIRLRFGTVEDLLIAQDFFEDLRRDGDDNQATTLGLATTLERLGTAYDATSRRTAALEPDPAMLEDPQAAALEHRAEAQNHWRQAVDLYQETLTDGEGSTTAMNGLQRTYALLGDYDRSLAWSGRLLDRSSEELEVWRRMLTQVDLSSSEEELFRENERIAQDLQTETHLFASTILNSQGRTQEAITHLDAVVESRPSLPQAYSLRAQLLVKHGVYDRALSDLDRFLALSDQPFEHPDVRRAFELRSHCDMQLRGAVAADGR
jgi:tetratricopeptide (TPR) repeat protein